MHKPHILNNLPNKQKKIKPKRQVNSLQHIANSKISIFKIILLGGKNTINPEEECDSS